MKKNDSTKENYENQQVTTALIPATMRMCG